jgi:hypothetical protein
MTTTRWIAAAAVAAAAFAAAMPAQAGRDCEAQPPRAEAVARGMTLAEKTAQALDASGEHVVVLARAGQDLSRHGLRWSHLGLAYRDTAADGRAVWRVVHKLNHCGTANAAVYRQGLGEFFLDNPHRYEAAFVPFTAEVQQRLLPLLRDNARVGRLHEPRYNMVAYPWAQTYQQSNQWAIETLASALEPGVRTRQQAQSWLQFKGYEPTALKLGTFTRLGARVGMANIAFDDHPNAKRFADRIETVTVDSVFDWLGKSGLADRRPTIVAL